jgi:CheY-like chemotaxis protein
MLASLGYTVWLAENGQEAIDQVLKNDLRIDAILMDQSMPVKDGVMATKEIREMEAAGTLSRRHPIIALTAVVSSQAQALFKSAGADDFLAKPLSLAKLEHTLSIHLPAQLR